MGAKSRTLKLTDAGLAALQHFAELECWGPIFSSSMIKSFHRACVAAGLPQREMLMHACQAGSWTATRLRVWSRGCGWRPVPSIDRSRLRNGWQYQAEGEKDRMNIARARSSAG